MNVLEYKGYHARIDYDAEDGILVGTVLDLADVIHFEIENAQDALRTFHEVIDDYLAFCARKGREPDKPFAGKIHVRTTPEIHKRAFLEAKRRAMSLNDLMTKALEAYLDPEEDAPRSVTVNRKSPAPAKAAAKKAPRAG